MSILGPRAILFADQLRRFAGGEFWTPINDGRAGYRETGDAVLNGYLDDVVSGTAQHVRYYKKRIPEQVRHEYDVFFGTPPEMLRHLLQPDDEMTHV